jgi:hypothetical protein
MKICCAKLAIKLIRNLSNNKMNRQSVELCLVHIAYTAECTEKVIMKSEYYLERIGAGMYKETIRL